jgi:flagellar hook protein FlgE
MALTSTLFTGLSGLDANSTRLNVAGNNIANANTVAFKGSRALFRPQFYVTDTGAAGPSSTFGGVNPSQRGLGTELASIQKDFDQGSIETTGKSTDLAIEGNGLFVVQGADQSFTRDGSFLLNAANQLVATNGDFIQGYGVDKNYQIVPGKLQNVTIPVGAASTAQATRNMDMTGNLNAGGAIATGASILTTQLLTRVGGGTAPTGATLLTDLADTSNNAVPLFSAGQTFTLTGVKGSQTLGSRTFTVGAGSTVDDLIGFYNGSLGIDTSVPANPSLPTPGAAIETDATDPASAHFVVVGNAGKANALDLGASSFTAAGASPFTFADGQNAAGFNSDPVGESVHTTAVVYDSLGTPVSVDITTVFDSTTANGTLWRFYATSPDNKDPAGSQIVGGGLLNFDSNGKLLNVTGNTIAIDRTGTGAATPFSAKLDFTGMTALASRNSDMAMGQQDGSPLGSLSSFTIGTDGIITGQFSNGLTRTLGQVAVATFSNYEGLDDRGAGRYVASANSGTPVIAAPGDLGAGMVRSGSLELSNVDLSKEFVNMIIASTGFSAASRVISTSNQLLTDLLNTTR